MASDSGTPSQLSPNPPETETSPTKSPKTPGETPSSPPTPSSSKGKEKIDDGTTTTINPESWSCGICLSENRKAIRGRIDSCDHSFCFVCIMEWAKVESRCPMCKRRFSTIRRPPLDGVFLGERVVNVPVRDQVYLCFGNSTVAPPDPYLEVRCTLCDSARDESLLLLCDLCDCAAHTYCVGLGATVPEGDWFCQDCILSKAEHDKNEPDTDCDNQMSFRNLHKKPWDAAHASILDIVRETRFREVERPTTALPHPNQLYSPIVPERRTSLAGSRTVQGSEANPSMEPNGTELGARTLRRCRNVHGRIRTLRENWNAFRSGSLSFSSNSVISGGNTNQKPNGGAVVRDRLVEPCSTPSSSQNLASQMASSSDTVPNRSSYDVDKAWKMMDAAKSMKQAHERTSIIHYASKQPLSKVNTPLQRAKSSSSLVASSGTAPGDLVDTGPQKRFRCDALIEGNDRHMPQIINNQKPDIISSKRILRFGEGSPSARSLGDNGLPSSRKIQASMQVNVCHRNVESATAVSNTSFAKLGASHSSKMGLPNGKDPIGNDFVANKPRIDDAKSEVKSLVKLNLKLLTRDRKLGVDAFKAIARLATHSILASCGFERPKRGVHSFPTSACCHSNGGQQCQMSTLMLGSCRECFLVFVKDVVNAIIIEKMGCA